MSRLLFALAINVSRYRPTFIDFPPNNDLTVFVCLPAKLPVFLTLLTVRHFAPFLIEIRYAKVVLFGEKL